VAEDTVVIDPESADYRAGYVAGEQAGFVHGMAAARLKFEAEMADRPVIHIPPTGINLDDEVRKAHLRALEMANWVQVDAAGLLGISSRVMNYRIRTVYQFQELVSEERKKLLAQNKIPTS
jgi:hypothetical protein